MGLLATSQFHFRIPSAEVSEEHIFSFQLNERGRAVTSVVVCDSVLISMEKLFLFTSVILAFPSFLCWI
jgi:aromatic ring hydroxylase